MQLQLMRSILHILWLCVTATISFKDFRNKFFCKNRSNSQRVVSTDSQLIGNPTCDHKAKPQFGVTLSLTLYSELGSRLSVHDRANVFVLP